MEQSSSWEVDRFSATQEIPRILCNLNVRYRIYKSLSKFWARSTQTVTPSRFSKIQLILSSHLRLGLLSGLLLSGSSLIHCMHLYSSTFVLHALPISVFLIWSPQLCNNNSNNTHTKTRTDRRKKTCTRTHAPTHAHEHARTHTQKYVIVIAFPWHQSFRENSSVLLFHDTSRFVKTPQCYFSMTPVVSWKLLNVTFPWHQSFRENYSMLLYTYFVCVV
jgi:hypothetical protein